MKHESTGFLKGMATGVCFTLGALLLWTVTTGRAFAADFETGMVLNHMLAACIEKQDAVDIVNADSKGGYDAGAAAFASKEKCGAVPVQGATVGNVVYSGPIERDGKKLSLQVVEIIWEGKVVAFFITSGTVGKASVLPKPKPTDGDGISMDGNRRGTNT